MKHRQQLERHSSSVAFMPSHCILSWREAQGLLRLVCRHTQCICLPLLLPPACCAFPAGSHVDGVHRRFLRAADGSVSFTGDAADMPAFDEARFLPVEVKAGSLVLLHGANVHLRWAGRASEGVTQQREECGGIESAFGGR